LDRYPAASDTPSSPERRVCGLFTAGEGRGRLPVGFLLAVRVEGCLAIRDSVRSASNPRDRQGGNIHEPDGYQGDAAFRCLSRLRLSNHDENLTMARHGGEHIMLAGLSPTALRGSWQLPVLAVTGSGMGRAARPWLVLGGRKWPGWPGRDYRWVGPARRAGLSAGWVRACRGWRLWRSRLR
jgi:hypothetical protein